MKVGPSSLFSNFLVNEDVQHSLAQMDLSDLGPARLETLKLPEQETFDLDIIDSHETLYNHQCSSSDSDEDSSIEWEMRT